VWRPFKLFPLKRVPGAVPMATPVARVWWRVAPVASGTVVVVVVGSGATTVPPERWAVEVAGAVDTEEQNLARTLLELRRDRNSLVSIRGGGREVEGYRPPPKINTLELSEAIINRGSASIVLR
jgi:hypothetical protein